MNTEIILEWDEEKRQRNIAERGIDFVDAVEVLLDPKMTLYRDVRKNYGENRFNAYGISKGRHLRICFTPRNGKFRIITIFKVHEKEWRKHYGKNN
jgi:uncharacterized DUF497 family protein